MLFVAGLNKKYIIIAVLSVIVIVPLLYFFILPPHAKTRIDVFLNPNLDPRGARIQCYSIKTCNWCRPIIWNGSGQRKSNPIRFFIS